MRQNEEWLEAANENFEHALNVYDVSLAKDIIADTFDAGFSERAREMSLELRQTKGALV